MFVSSAYSIFGSVEILWGVIRYPSALAGADNRSFKQTAMQQLMASKGHDPYITITHGGVGYLAVHICWNPDGFLEPYVTGFGRYAKAAEAVSEAKEWAEAEGIKYVPPKELDGWKDPSVISLNPVV
jgi:hypothetical protein